MVRHSRDSSRTGTTYLANQLHVTVLDTVVHHLDVVAGALVTNPLAAGLAVRLGGDGLEDVLDVWPGLLVTTRHDAGAIASALLSSGDSRSDEADALGLEVFCAAVGVGVVRVTAIDDDVALFYATLVEKKLDEVVDGLAGHDKHHHATGLLELLHKLLDGVGANNGLALGLCDMSGAGEAGDNEVNIPSLRKRSTLATLVDWSASQVPAELACASLRAVECYDLASVSYQ